MMTIPTFVVNGVGMIPLEKTSKTWAYYFSLQTKYTIFKNTKYLTPIDLSISKYIGETCQELSFYYDVNDYDFSQFT
jgi:hypothetical protein